MRKKILGILLVMMLVVFSNMSYAFDDGDAQYWSTTSGSVKINDEWKFNIEEELRFGDDASEFYYHHTDAGFLYSGLSDWLDVGFNYRAVWEKKSDEWTFENRPHINAILKTVIYDAKVSNRSRLEFRIKESNDDELRYRNKTTIKFPVKWTKFEWQPYIADEIFVDFDSTELSRNRLYVGFGGKIFKNMKAGLYYMFQNSKSSGEWKESNIVGTKMKFSF